MVSRENNTFLEQMDIKVLFITISTVVKTFRGLGVTEILGIVFLTYNFYYIGNYTHLMKNTSFFSY